MIDLRSGMSNAGLMEKYSLSPSGLQSLFDKLLTSGAIDLAEIRDRMPGKWGTVPIREENHLRLINAQEAARDIRAGLDDGSLMRKYGLSFNGLQTLFDKLLELQAVRQLDLDERRFSSLERVDLDDDTVDVSTIIEQMFSRYSAESLGIPMNKPREPEVRNTHEKKPHGTSPSNGKRPPVATARNTGPGGNGNRKSLPRPKPDSAPLETPWYDKPLIVVALLIGLFPLGFHALFRNRTLSSRAKGCVAVGWFLLAAISLKLLVGLI